MQGDRNIPCHDQKSGDYVTVYTCQNSVSFTYKTGVASKLYLNKTD